MDNVVIFPQPPAERPLPSPDPPVRPVMYTRFCPPLPQPANDRLDIRKRRYAMLAMAAWGLLYMVPVWLFAASMLWIW